MPPHIYGFGKSLLSNKKTIIYKGLSVKQDMLEFMYSAQLNFIKV